MRPWKHTVGIKDLIGDDPCPPAEEIRSKASTIVSRFEAKMPEAVRSPRLTDALEEFGWLAEATDDSDEEMVESFNDCLNGLYDAADADRIWLGI